MDRFAKVLPMEVIQAASRFVRWQDTVRRVVGRALVHLVFSRILGVRPPDVPVVRGRNGKPIIPGELDFSISHSGEWVLIAIDRRQVGVDIEQRKRRSEAFAKAFLCRQERRCFLNAAQSDHASMVTRLWTIKESYLKAEGVGLLGGIRDVMVRDAGEYYVVQRPDGKCRFVKTFRPDSRTEASVCMCTPVFPRRLSSISSYELLELFDGGTKQARPYLQKESKCATEKFN
jgi:4'-phosphopantetheinyl transferase